MLVYVKKKHPSGLVALEKIKEIRNIEMSIAIKNNSLETHNTNTFSNLITNKALLWLYTSIPIPDTELSSGIGAVDRSDSVTFAFLTINGLSDNIIGYFGVAISPLTLRMESLPVDTVICNSIFYFNSEPSSCCENYPSIVMEQSFWSHISKPFL